MTLERPERRNAFSADLMREMIACAQELSSRRDIDAVSGRRAAASPESRAAREQALKRPKK